MLLCGVAYTPNVVYSHLLTKKEKKSHLCRHNIFCMTFKSNDLMKYQLVKCQPVKYQLYIISVGTPDEGIPCNTL